MANLIITIISIALVAVAALAGMWYGGSAYLSNTTQVRATTLIQQSSQLSAIQQSYLLSRALMTFDQFQTKNMVASGFAEAIPIVNFEATPHGSDNYYNACNANTTWEGKKINATRASCAMNGKNVIHYTFQDATIGCFTPSVDFADAGSADHPLVKLCLKLNSRTKLPTGLSYAASGIPYGTGSESLTGCSNTSYMDGNNYNFCYMRTGVNDTLHFTFLN